MLIKLCIVCLTINFEVMYALLHIFLVIFIWRTVKRKTVWVSGLENLTTVRLIHHCELMKFSYQCIVPLGGFCILLHPILDSCINSLPYQGLIKKNYSGWEHKEKHSRGNKCFHWAGEFCFPKCFPAFLGVKCLIYGNLITELCKSGYSNFSKI